MTMNDFGCWRHFHADHASSFADKCAIYGKTVIAAAAAAAAATCDQSQPQKE